MLSRAALIEIIWTFLITKLKQGFFHLTGLYSSTKKSGSQLKLAVFMRYRDREVNSLATALWGCVYGRHEINDPVPTPVTFLQTFRLDKQSAIVIASGHTL